MSTVVRTITKLYLDPVAEIDTLTFGNLHFMSRMELDTIRTKELTIREQA